MMLLYSALLALGLTLSAPWWLLRMLTTERYREGLGERLGRVPARLRTAVAGKRVVWLHAVSVGEVLAASRLVGELEAALNAGSHGAGSDGAGSHGAGSGPWQVVVSTTTRTGQALARERFGAERVFYFPLDFAWAVRAYLRVLRPAALVLMESELWPRVLHECRRNGIPVAVLNARVSDRSFDRAMRVRGVWGRVLRGVSLWLMQSDEDAARIIAMGAQEGAVRIGGNLKYDVRAPKESRVAELIREAAGERQILVGGSTLGENPSEDSPLIRAQESMPEGRRPLLVLAPRHPEEFDTVYSVAMEYPTLRATEMLAGKSRTEGFSARLREGERALVEIVVLDTIGDLAAVYGVANVAFVGGSLVRRGGHNPLEPAQFGIPVIMGPSFENFRGVVAAMQNADAISIVHGKAPRERMSKTDVSKDLSLAARDEIVRLLTDREAARAMGKRGKRVFEEQQGATARAVEAIVQLMGSSGANQ